MTFSWCKKKVFDVKKITKTPKLDVFQQKFPVWFRYWFYLLLTIFCQCKVMFSKKYCLWTLFLAKCSECDVWWQGLFKIFCTCVSKPSSYLLVISWNFQERNIIFTLLKLQIRVVHTVFYHPNCLICTD